MKLQVSQALSMSLRLLFFCSLHLINPYSFDLLTLCSFLDQFVVISAYLIVSWLENLWLLLANLGWYTCCLPAFHAGNLTQYPLSSIFVNTMYNLLTKSVFVNWCCFSNIFCTCCSESCLWHPPKSAPLSSSLTAIWKHYPLYSIILLYLISSICL